jgi:hypothetical protein
MPWGEPWSPRPVDRDDLDDFRREVLGEFPDQPPFTITGDEARDMRNVVESFEWCIVSNRDYVDHGTAQARRQSMRRLNLWRDYRARVLDYYKENPCPTSI